MTGDQAKQYLYDYKIKTDPLLEKFLDEKKKDASRVGEPAKNVIRALKKLTLRGKRIRGALANIGYQIAADKPNGQMYKESLTMEIFHAGLLIHDDIMDDADTRRGIPALHIELAETISKAEAEQNREKTGQALAILAGDVAFYLSWELLHSSTFPSDRVAKASKIVAQYGFRVMAGQALDIANSGKTMSQQQTLMMMHMKSGEYTSELPLVFGATLAGGMTKDKKQAMMEYAKSMGWIFQIQDDVLGIFGDEQKTGKPNTNDISEGKMTLLMLHLKKYGSNKQKSFQKKLLGKPDISTEELQQMRVVLREAGSYEYAHALADEYIKKGKKQINKITNNQKTQHLLESFLIFMKERMK